MGMLTEWLGARRAELKARRRYAETMEGLFQNVGDIGNRYVDVDAALYGWDTRASGATAESRRVNLAVARKESRDFIAVNAHAKNIVNQIVNFVVGKGFAIKFADETAGKQWREDSQQIGWPKRRRETIRRIGRDGEALMRRFKSNQLRFVEPERLKTPPEESEGFEHAIMAGIRFAENDVEDVQGYFVDGEELGPDEVFHWKDPFADANDLRGWPMIYDAKPIIERYERWIHTRAILNELRSAVIVMRKHKGMTPTQVAAFADKVKGGTIDRPGGKTQPWIPKWLAGTTIDATGDIEYEFPAANIDAGDVESDGRLMRLLIAVYFQMPEYWATGDASNANFASSLVAENPGIMAMQSLQEFFANDIQRFVAWWFGEPMDTTIVFPNLVNRDPLKDSQSRAIMEDHGVLSIETWQELEGLDPLKERERIAQGE